MEKVSLLLFTLLLLSFEAFAQGPGGVSGNLRWWLRANTGTFTDNGTTAATNGQSVQQWNDQSVMVNNARQTTLANKPVYRTNIINGNPVLRFSSDQFLDALAGPGVGPTESFYMFLVFSQNSYVAGGTNDGNGTFIVDRPTATNNLMSFKIVNTDKYFYQKRNDTGGSLTGPVSVTSAPTNVFSVIDYYRNVGINYGIHINGRLDVTSGGDSENITGPAIRIGRHATTTNGGINGDIAEVVLYNTNLSNADRNRVESYLAIKYGITLNQTTPTSYVNSSGTVVYPAATSHDLYDFDIAGIARDNASALNQTGSQSQNQLSIVRIFNPSSLDDGDFLLWGHSSPTIWNSTDVPAPYINRLTRIWRVAETGETGTFSISFDLTGLGVDMSDPTRFALLVDADGNFSDATAHITGRTVVGNVVTFTGAGINNNEYFSLACPLIPGPGGVAATTVWLRADEDVYVNAGTTLATNGQLVQQWNTRGGVTGANATQATSGNRPTYVTNTMNGNPALRFGAGTQFMDLGALGISNTSDLNMALVIRPTANGGGGLGNTTGGYVIDRTSNTTPVYSMKLLGSGRAGLQLRPDSNPPFDGIITTSTVTLTLPHIIDYSRDYAVRFGIYYNGALENVLAESIGSLTFPTPRIGARESGNNGLSGDLAEFIFFNRDISAVERNRIDSYLAIKYGITLNQATLTNYTASTGTVVFPATTSHSSYNRDIAGIGRDAVSRLNQTNSQSANVNSVVRIQNASSLDDLDFLLWGSNGNALNVRNTADVGAPILGRMSRVWRIAETGETGTVTVSFDLTMVGNKTQSTLRLLIDRDGDGFADNDVTPLTGTLTGEIFTVTGVNFQNNDYFTIGSTDLAATPLPVELVSFEGVYEHPVVDLMWKTESELNNDYFTLERSASGKQFEEVARIEGAGTTNDPKTYLYVDPAPFPNETYYRLKQTDFDGTFEYSNIIRVETGRTKNRKISVYPNPNTGDEFTITLDNSTRFQVSQVEIFSQQSVMLASYIPDAESAPEFSFNLGRQLAAGLYIVRITYNNKVESVKLVVR